MPLRPGETFGPFKIVDHLGRGGMGTVFRAFEPSPGRHVALKVLPTEYLSDESFAERFRREARFIANLEHRNIVPLYTVGIDEGIPWMAMRLISGGTLSTLLPRGRLSVERCVAILSGIAAALDYAHARKIIHRDVKPQNVLLDETGHVYLSDFGLARILESGSLLHMAHSLTGGGILGTPHYMAPEQAGGRTIDHRCDIYALGIVAYEMLAGRVPFTGDTPIQVLMKHASEAVPPLPPAEVSPALAGPVMKALEKDPNERWPSAGAFVQALEEGLGQSATPIVQPTRPSPAPPKPTPPPTARPTALTPSPVRPAVEGPRERVPYDDKPVAGYSRATVVALSAVAVGAVVALGLGVLLVLQLQRSQQSTVAKPAPASTLPAATRPSEPPREAVLEIRSSVAGASVTLDGREVGRAPASLPVAPGPHVVELRKPGCGSTTLRVDVQPGARLPIEPTLQCVAPSVAPPSPRAAVATLSPAPTSAPSPAMAAANGFLQVVVVPWADVTVDGAAVVAGPLRKIPLTPGSHLVRLLHPDFEPLQRTVTIKAGETLSLSVDLPEEGVRKVR